MVIRREEQSMNYTEYFFEMVDVVDNLKPNNKIKTIGLGESYYSPDETNVIFYKNKKIEILHDRYLGGTFNKLDNKYERSTRHFSCKEDAEKTTLILSRVGEHLFDFHHQLYDIYESGIADSVIMLLPDMSKVIENIGKNITKCATDNCIDFKYNRDVLELLSTTNSELSDLHRVYTSPNTINTLLTPCLKNNMFAHSTGENFPYFDIIECGIKINGYDHFMVFIEFNKFAKCKFNPSVHTPIFDFDKNGLTHNGVYLLSGDMCEKIKGLTHNNNFLKNYDTIVFNKILSRNNIEMNIFGLYDMCKYIRPGTKIWIIEDDMLSIAKDIENINSGDIDSYWKLNTLLFGLNYQSSLPHTFNYLNHCKQTFVSPSILDVFMTQEGLYAKDTVDGNENFSFIYNGDYTFHQHYIRI